MALSTSLAATEEEREFFEEQADRIIKQVQGQFQDEYRKAMEQMQKDHEAMREIFEDESLRELQDQFQMFFHAFIGEDKSLDYSWHLKEGKRVLHLRLKLADEPEFDLDIKDWKITISAKVISSRDQSTREVSQVISIPRDADYTRPEYEKDGDLIKISFPLISL